MAEGDREEYGGCTLRIPVQSVSISTHQKFLLQYLQLTRGERGPVSPQLVDVVPLGTFWTGQCWTCWGERKKIEIKIQNSKYYFAYEPRMND